jgi:hypothetical protein
MNHSRHESERSTQHDHFGSSSTRRTFMKRVIGGLAIAVPAYQVLASAAPAVAAIPACGSTCPILVAQWCAGQFLSSSCKGPSVSACMQEWRSGGKTIIVHEGYCF